MENAYIGEQTARLEGWEFKPKDTHLVGYLNKLISENQMFFRPFNVEQLTQGFVFSLSDAAYIPIGNGVWYFFSVGALSDAWHVRNPAERKAKDGPRLLGRKRSFTVEQALGHEKFSWEVSEYHTMHANPRNWVLLRIRKLRMCSTCNRPLTNRAFLLPHLNELPPDPDLNDQVPQPNDEVPQQIAVP